MPSVLAEEEMQFKENFTVGDILYEGHFGDVHTCTENDTSEKYAVKTITLSKDGNNNQAIREGVIWRRLTHRNVVQLVRIFKTPLKEYLLLEYVQGDHLVNQVVNSTTYTERDTCYFMMQLFEVLAFLREKQIIHRNIKPGNLLVNKGAYGEVLKLTDFGLAVRLNKVENEVKVEASGVPLYLAPETILEKSIGYAIDLWSAGVIFYILLCGYPPFWNERLEKLYADIVTKDIQMSPVFWDDVSDEAKSLTHSLLDKNISRRITAKDAMQHAWVLEQDGIPKIHRKKTLEKLNEFNSRSKLKGEMFTVQTLYCTKKTKQRSTSHGGNRSHSILKPEDQSRRASTSVLGNKNYPDRYRKSSVISKTNYSDLPNERKLSEVNVKFHPMQLVINLNECATE